MKLRFDYTPFMEKINHYFDQLLEQVVDLQVTTDGPIILMQVENEYGGYANDKSYMRKMAEMMIEKGVNVPLVTSDGPWGDMLENGSIPDIALPTINFGSKVKEHFKRLREFHGDKRPLMVMEFWIGWFDAWGDEAHHTTSVEEATNELSDILSEGSVNIYMFHGGTNFGFTSGANYYEKLLPDVTSYNYDALLAEWGDITPKYEAFKEVIRQYAEIPEFPLTTKIQKKNYGQQKVAERVSLFEIIDKLSQKVYSNYPVSMEALNQGREYIYYRSQIGPARPIDDFRLISTIDRAHIFINNKLQQIQYDLEIGQKESLVLEAPNNELGILVENMGRVNYSVKMNHQHKGIKDGVLINGAFQSEWEMYSLLMDNLEKVNFLKDYIVGQPSFSRFLVEMYETGDTFIDLTGWGKGFVPVNGFNIGRYWKKGLQKRLYIPAPILKVGTNELIVFESDGEVADFVTLTDIPDLG